jgi:hypothetical protein
MRFQKANYSDYLKAAPAPEPSASDRDGDERAPAVPAATAAPSDPYGLLDATDVAERLESLCAARRVADGPDAETFVAAPAPAPAPASQEYDLLPKSRARRRRIR